MPERTVRLSRKQYALLVSAVKYHADRVCDTKPDEFRRIQRMVRAWPRSLPYDLTLNSDEWKLVSRALRPVEEPLPGTEAARWRALYQWLRGFNQFYGMRVLSPRTQREHAQRLGHVARSRSKRIMQGKPV